MDPRSAREPETPTSEIPNPIVQALTADPSKTPRAMELMAELLELIGAEPAASIGP
jgi:hypothetical protein